MARGRSEWRTASWRRCAPSNTTTVTWLNTTAAKAELSVTLCNAMCAAVLGSGAARRGGAGAALFAHCRSNPAPAVRRCMLRAVILQNILRQLGGVVEAREGDAWRSCWCGGFRLTRMITPRLVAASDRAHAWPIWMADVVVSNTTSSIKVIGLSAIARPSDKPSIHICPTCTTITTLPPPCLHPHYTIPPSDPEYPDALYLYLNPPC